MRRVLREDLRDEWWLRSLGLWEEVRTEEEEVVDVRGIVTKVCGESSRSRGIAGISEERVLEIRGEG